MIALRLLRHGLLSAAIFSGAASAVELGEINLHSRIGETLRADIPVIAGGQPLAASCFTLAPVAGADLPVITSARTRLVRSGQDYRLILTSSKTIDEPIVVINLHASCGIAVQREYVLLPAPPTSVGDSTPSGEVSAPLGGARPEPLNENGMAAGALPERPAARPRPAKTPPSPTAKARKPLARDTLANLASHQDRIVLGAAPDDRPPPGAGDPLAPVNALDERLLRMETTLHLLNQEVDKLNTAITLRAESRTVREKLHDMQAQQATPGLLANAQATTLDAPVRAKSRADGWLELLAGLLLGGSVSAGVAHLVSRRQDTSGRFAGPPPRIAKPRRPAKV